MILNQSDFVFDQVWEIQKAGLRVKGSVFKSVRVLRLQISRPSNLLTRSVPPVSTIFHIRRSLAALLTRRHLDHLEMLRNNPRRAGLKALQAIKDNGQNAKNKVRRRDACSGIFLHFYHVNQCPPPSSHTSHTSLSYSFTPSPLSFSFSPGQNQQVREPPASWEEKIFESKWLHSGPGSQTKEKRTGRRHQQRELHRPLTLERRVSGSCAKHGCGQLESTLLAHRLVQFTPWYMYNCNLLPPRSSNNSSHLRRWLLSSLWFTPLSPTRGTFETTPLSHSNLFGYPVSPMTMMKLLKSGKRERKRFKLLGAIDLSMKSEHVLMIYTQCAVVHSCSPLYPHLISSSLGSAGQDTPVTAMQNVLQATTLDDSGSGHSELPFAEVEPTPLWTNIDQPEAHDPSYTSEYAPEIYQYMMQREVSAVYTGTSNLCIVALSLSLSLSESSKWNHTCTGRRTLAMQ